MLYETISVSLVHEATSNAAEAAAELQGGVRRVKAALSAAAAAGFEANLRLDAEAFASLAATRRGALASGFLFTVTSGAATGAARWSLFLNHALSVRAATRRPFVAFTTDAEAQADCVEALRGLPPAQDGQSADCFYPQASFGAFGLEPGSAVDAFRSAVGPARPRPVCDSLPRPPAAPRIPPTAPPASRACRRSFGRALLGWPSRWPCTWRCRSALTHSLRRLTSS